MPIHPVRGEGTRHNFDEELLKERDKLTEQLAAERQTVSNILSWRVRFDLTMCKY